MNRTIETVDDLKARCTVVDDCWILPGKGVDIRVGGAQRSFGAAVQWLLEGKPGEAGTWRPPICGRPRCLNPAHRPLLPRTTRPALLGRRGRKGPPKERQPARAVPDWTPVQRTISATGAPALKTDAPRSVFDLGGA